MLKRSKIKSDTSHIRRKGKLRYSSKKYVNPFFQHKKKKRKKPKLLRLNLTMKIILISVALIVLVGIGFIFYSNFFKIKNVIISGGGRIDTREVEKITWQQINDNFLLIFPQSNIIFFSKQRLINNLNQKYAFEELAIEKKYRDTLQIKYQEKVYALIWQEGETFYYADVNGSVITEANLLEVEHKDYPVMENRTNEVIFDRQISADQETINFTLRLFSALKNQDEFKVSRYIIDNEKNTVKALLDVGVEVYFNTRLPVQKQLDKLLIVKNEKLLDDFPNKTYIDVRYGESVYFR